MKKIIVIALAFLLTLVSTVSAKPGPASPVESIVPANAKWIIHVDMEQFRRTRISEAIKGDKINWFTIANQMMKTKHKIDLIHDTIGITLFGMGGDKRDVVACVNGNFDKEFVLSRVRQAAGYQKTTHGGLTVHKWRGSQFGVFVDDHLLVYSLHPMSEAALKDVLDTIAGRTRNTGTFGLMEHLKKMPKDAILKAAAENISELGHHGHASMIIEKTGMAFFVAMERNENLMLKLKLTTDGPETAKNFEQMINGFIALARMKHEKADPRLEILNRLKTTLKGNVLQVELSYPSDDLITMLEYKHKMPFQQSHE